MTHLDAACDGDDSSEATRELVARSGAGDAAALDRLIRRFYGRVERMVRVRMSQFLRQRQAVVDVVQDVFVRVIMGIERFESRDDARFIDWLARLAQRELANHARREGAHKRAGSLTQRVRRQAEAVDAADLAGDSTGPASNVARRELTDRVDACLAELGEDHREVILLRDYAGGSWRTVAETMGRPSPAACEELYRRAKLALLTKLSQSQR